MTTTRRFRTVTTTVKMMIHAPISVKMWNTVKRTAWDVMIKETWACYVRTIVKINAVNA